MRKTISENTLLGSHFGKSSLEFGNFQRIAIVEVFVYMYITTVSFQIVEISVSSKNHLLKCSFPLLNWEVMKVYQIF
jgi:hypothetical protein